MPLLGQHVVRAAGDCLGPQLRDCRVVEDTAPRVRREDVDVQAEDLVGLDDVDSVFAGDCGDPVLVQVGDDGQRTVLEDLVDHLRADRSEPLHRNRALAQVGRAPHLGRAGAHGLDDAERRGR